MKFFDVLMVNEGGSPPALNIHSAQIQNLDSSLRDPVSE